MSGSQFLHKCYISSSGSFIKQNIIWCYGVLEELIIDNEANLNGRMIRQLCQQFKIVHWDSTPYRPQMNRVVEAANKNVKKILAKITSTFKYWHDYLPFALYGYHTSIRTSSGTTPYSLLYEMEAVLPIEFEVLLLESWLNRLGWSRMGSYLLRAIKHDSGKAHDCYLSWTIVPTESSSYIQQESLYKKVW